MSKYQKEAFSSPAEEYAFHFQNPEPKHYTRIPNILDHLTFRKKVKGIEKTCRLSVYAKELYRIIRMIASDRGLCWMTTKHLADTMNCSVGTICKAKKELMSSMDQLDGNSLIIEKRRMSAKRDPLGVITSSREQCTYTIVDIWPWNNAYMQTLKYHKTDSPSESMGGTDSPSESVSLGTDSPGEPNNISINNISLLKEQHLPANADSVVSFSKEKMFPSDEMQSLFESMVKAGCEEKTAKRLVLTHPRKDILAASNYVTRQSEKARHKRKSIENKWGYLQTVLQNRYWEK